MFENLSTAIVQAIDSLGVFVFFHINFFLMKEKRSMVKKRLTRFLNPLKVKLI